MAAKKVFLIQDDAQLQAVVTRVLKLEGFAVETTDQAEQIVSAASSAHPDIIVLDDVFQQQNTMAACKQLKRQFETQDIPVIIVSSHPHARERAKEAEADDVLPKPISFFDLLDTVQSFVM